MSLREFIGCGGSRSVNRGYSSRRALCDGSSQKMGDPSKCIKKKEIRAVFHAELEVRM